MTACMQAGVFVLLDLRPWLAGDTTTYEDEHRLWEHILNTADVNLTPGALSIRGLIAFLPLFSLSDSPESA